jgi:ATP-dependent DNA ligase
MEILGEIGMYVIPVSLATRGFDCTYRAQLLEDATKFKLEGWVLKESHMEGWYKLKPVKTIDAFVVDVTESDSETYKGYMKAVKLGIYDWNSRHTPTHDLGECGIGFNKEFKLSKSYSDMRVDLIGRVCEIAFDSFTKDHKLRFPRFIRWRDDKDMTNCTTEQLK